LGFKQEFISLDLKLEKSYYIQKYSVAFKQLLLRETYTLIFIVLFSISPLIADEGGEIIAVSLEGDWLVVTTSELYPPRVSVETNESPPTIYIDMIGATISGLVGGLPSGGLVAFMELWQYKYNPLVARLAVICEQQVRYSIYRKKYDGEPAQIRIQLEALESSSFVGDISREEYPLMSEPREDALVLAGLAPGQTVQVTGSSGEWLEVRTEDGLVGWLLACTISIKDDQSAPGTIRAEIVEGAKDYLGVPYLYGGQSREGMDCSGLVQQVYSEVGLSIPRECHDQYDEAINISRKELKPGDLVFFSTTSSGPSHVGIYIGGDSFIHAESSSAGVTITRLDAVYWKDRIYGFATYLQ